MSYTRKVTSARFNQDYSCFSCCTESGVRIYNVDPLVEKSHYDLEKVGSVSKCEMLNRTNLIAIISGGSRPKFPDNHLLVYDDLSQKFVLDLSFGSSVVSVRMRGDRLIVVLLRQIHIFEFPLPTHKLHTLETKRNPKGICEISSQPTSQRQIIVYPGFKIGSLFIQNLQDIGRETSVSSCISAHESEVGCIALNQSSTRLATASYRGTLIRIWDTASKTKILEVRRGSDPATINCLNFSSDNEYLCCCSDKGTVHIFAVKNTDMNKRMSIPGGSLLGSYGSSQWGFANFTVPPETAAECAFGEKNSVIAICLDGSYYKYSFTSDGVCQRQTYDIYLDCDDDEESNIGCNLSRK